MGRGEKIHSKEPEKGLNGQVKLLYILTFLTECLAAAILISTIIWLHKYQGGFDWKDGRNFNFHPLFMIVGLILCYGNAAIAFRVFRLNENHRIIVKICHAMLHTCAFVFAVLGLLTVFNFHNHGNIPNMYSIHSWVGMGTVVLFACQLTGGYLAFLLPFTPVIIKKNYLKIHGFFGLAILALAVVSVISGFTEKLGWIDDYSSFVAPGNLGNIICLLVVLFSTLIVFIASNRNFKKNDVPYMHMNGTKTGSNVP